MVAYLELKSFVHQIGDASWMTGAKSGLYYGLDYELHYALEFGLDCTVSSV